MKIFLIILAIIAGLIILYVLFLLLMGVLLGMAFKNKFGDEKTLHIVRAELYKRENGESGMEDDELRRLMQAIDMREDYWVEKPKVKSLTEKKT
jgi:hypothetical protein